MLKIADAQISVGSGISISATVVDNGQSGGTTPPHRGGGGGGGFYNTTSTVNFSGSAYPMSRVYILQDGTQVVSTIAGPDAKFAVSFINVSSGNYNFTVYGEDSSGRKSADFSFPLIIASGVTVDISGIFITPTIGVDKSAVARGDNLQIFGQSIPDSSVVISVHSPVETFYKIPTDKNGAYLYTLDTSSLDLGTHTTKSKTVSTDSVSEYGKSIDFVVGDKNILANTCGAGKGDLNCDGFVNLIDYSIMAFWYKKHNPPAKVDLNGDGVVDLVDFSILAYYWTGY